MSNAVELILLGANFVARRTWILLCLVGMGAVVGIPFGLLLVAMLRRMESKRANAYHTAWVPMSVLGVGWVIATLWFWLYCADLRINPGRGDVGLADGIVASACLLGAGLYAYPFWIATYWLLKHYPRRELDNDSQLRDFKHASLFLTAIVLMASIVLIAMYPLIPHERPPVRITNEPRTR